MQRVRFGQFKDGAPYKTNKTRCFEKNPLFYFIFYCNQVVYQREDWKWQKN
jgi:hypothetical protein